MPNPNRKDHGNNILLKYHENLDTKSYRCTKKSFCKRSDRIPNDMTETRRTERKAEDAEGSKAGASQPVNDQENASSRMIVREKFYGSPDAMKTSSRLVGATEHTDEEPAARVTSRIGIDEPSQQDTRTTG